MADDWMDQELERKARAVAQAEQARNAAQAQAQLIASKAPAAWRALCDAIKAGAEEWNAKPAVGADSTRRVVIESGYDELRGGTMIGEHPHPGRRITGQMNIAGGTTTWAYTIDTVFSPPRVVRTAEHPIVAHGENVSIGRSTNATAEELLRGLVKLILES